MVYLKHDIVSCLVIMIDSCGEKILSFRSCALIRSRVKRCRNNVSFFLKYGISRYKKNVAFLELHSHKLFGVAVFNKIFNIDHTSIVALSAMTNGTLYR